MARRRTTIREAIAAAAERLSGASPGSTFVRNGAFAAGAGSLVVPKGAVIWSIDASNESATQGGYLVALDEEASVTDTTTSLESRGDVRLRKLRAGSDISIVFRFGWEVHRGLYLTSSLSASKLTFISGQETSPGITWEVEWEWLDSEKTDRDGEG